MPTKAMVGQSKVNAAYLAVEAARTAPSYQIELQAKGGRGAQASAWATRGISPFHALYAGDGSTYGAGDGSTYVVGTAKPLVKDHRGGRRPG